MTTTSGCRYCYVRFTKVKLYTTRFYPFNPETWVPYQLQTDSPVVISIYDIRGQLIRVLNLGHQDAGYYVKRDTAAYWNGRNLCGERVASGVYYYTYRPGSLEQ